LRTKIRFAGVVCARLYGYSVITDITSVLLQHWRVSEYSMITTGASAIKAALETQSIGIEKIPTKSHIDENASYLFSRV
jgi:hypothetical protein